MNQKAFMQGEQTRQSLPLAQPSSCEPARPGG